MMLTLTPPKEFDYNLCFQFLKRSPKELLHTLYDKAVYKAIRIDTEVILFRVEEKNGLLIIDFLNGKPTLSHQERVKQFVTEWFDLDTDLKPFYRMAQNDEILGPLIKKYFGYRIVGQPDLFESLVWAVLGQQINLDFAYTLKQRFVEKFGDAIQWNGNTYYLFPSAEMVARLTDADLLPLQFSRQKSNYCTGIAKAFAERIISKNQLTGLAFEEAKEKLMALKGVGNWTANYALMKTFRYPNAFPLEDAGLHNALKNQLGLAKKPGLDQIKKIFNNYSRWESYATLYLWKSLESTS
ncbi:MAG: DNA-3-methyladenine glycosylase 2 family protein [Cyclobacteriaceae bacterium]|nr:DNA-3-methyladenine glycosylase 2 family protein [Cyclobacteriaceae bacterium]UYN87173.1 MAG: DNA-3-methyladenine glycosylase 2 family protein [Cyclobacteriaceae bacterium]